MTNVYTLIAFKPEYQFHDRGDDEVLPARCEREEHDTLESVIERVTKLRTERPLVEYRYGQQKDVVFDSFWVFEAPPIDVDDEVRRRVRAWREQHDAVNLARDDQREAEWREVNTRSLERLRELGIWPRKGNPE